MTVTRGILFLLAVCCLAACERRQEPLASDPRLDSGVTLGGGGRIPSNDSIQSSRITFEYGTTAEGGVTRGSEGN